MNYPFLSGPMPALNSPFPSLEALPLFKNAVYECGRTIQAPHEMIGLVALSAISVAVQRDNNVLAPYGKELPVSLAVAGVALSGERKDGVTSYFYSGFGRLRKQLNQRHREAHTKWKVEHSIWKMKRKRIENAINKKLHDDESIELEEMQLQSLQVEEPVEPAEAMYVLEDATSAALAEQMDKAGGCIAVVSSEGASFLFGRTSENLGLINTAWSGSPIVIARKKGGSIEIPEPRLTCLILAQPSVFAEYMNGRGAQSRGIGFWARFLVCSPLSNQGYRSLDGSVQPTTYRDAFATRIMELAKPELAIGMDTAHKRNVVVLNKEADFLWQALANAIEAESRIGGRYEFAQDHASKLAENILRVAALLHVFEGFEGGISRETLYVAIGICFYSSSEFLRLFAAPPQSERDIMQMRNWLHWKKSTGVRYLLWRYVRNSGPNGLRENGRMFRALESLVCLREIREIKIGHTRCIDLDLYANYDEGRARYELNLPSHYSRGI
jgi:hypothetical protein